MLMGLQRAGQVSLMPDFSNSQGWIIIGQLYRRIKTQTKEMNTSILGWYPHEP